MADITYRNTLTGRALKMVGRRALTLNIPGWMAEVVQES